jgi:hypothetical protein
MMCAGQTFKKSLIAPDETRLPVEFGGETGFFQFLVAQSALQIRTITRMAKSRQRIFNP